MISCVLVATDGTPDAMGAVEMARLLAARDGARVEVLTVFDPPMQFYGLEAVGIAAGVPSPYGLVAIEELRRRVEIQLAGVGGGASEWPISVKVDSCAPAIARFASECGAALVLMGLRPHVAVERWLGRGTLLRVIHLSHVPVLAVPADARGLPQRVVAAVDLSELSLRAVQSLPALLAPGSQLHLVHATWAPLPGENWATMDWVKTYRTGVEERIEALASELRSSAALEVHVHVRETGDPAHEILRLADEVGAELIAAGSHGHGFLGRIVLGSVSSKLLHGARCAVLIAPPAEAPPELRPVLEMDDVLAPPGTP